MQPNFYTNVHLLGSPHQKYYQGKNNNVQIWRFSPMYTNNSVISVNSEVPIAKRANYNLAITDSLFHKWQIYGFGMATGKKIDQNWTAAAAVAGLWHGTCMKQFCITMCSVSIWAIVFRLTTNTETYRPALPACKLDLPLIFANLLWSNMYYLLKICHIEKIAVNIYIRGSMIKSTHCNESKSSTNYDSTYWYSPSAGCWKLTYA